MNYYFSYPLEDLNGLGKNQEYRNYHYIISKKENRRIGPLLAK